MGLFKKKPDPISERARELNARIDALQSEIKKLSQQPPPSSPTPAESRDLPNVPPAAPPPHPKLRSTARPHGPTINVTPPPPEPPPLKEPIFEELDQDRLKRDPEPKPAPVDLTSDLGMRKKGVFALLHRFRQHFRGPATSNPKLVNYLAAGSIQGLRPLRYEKRIARNRFVMLAALLILLLWGIIAILIKHR